MWLPISFKGASVLQYFPRIPTPSSVTVKQSAVAVASIAGVITVLSAALYFKRKRQKNFQDSSSDGLSVVSTSSNRKSRRRKTSTANSSNSRLKIRRSKRHRNTSINTTFTSSSTASSVINRWTDSENFGQVESLYQEGVDALENALCKWEQASTLLHSTNDIKNWNADNKSLNFDERNCNRAKHRRTNSLGASPLKVHPHPGRSNSFTSSSPIIRGRRVCLSQSDGNLDGLLSELRGNRLSTSASLSLLSSSEKCCEANNWLLRNKVNTSTTSVLAHHHCLDLTILRSLTDSDLSTLELLVGDKVHLRNCLRKLVLPSVPCGESSGDATDEQQNDKNQVHASYEEQLSFISERALRLQESFESLLFDSDPSSDSDITLTGFADLRVSDADSESNDSYVSARETWDNLSETSQPRKMYMYEKALEDVERGKVLCRTMRCELLCCDAEEDFLAKLQCIRQGFDTMLQDVAVRDWLIETGRSMIECILCAAERNIQEFQTAFSRMINFVNDPKNWPKIEEELQDRGVVQMNFYDIVLDFLLMDAFDDLSHPPGGVMSILQNRWLAASLKESALSAAVWSVLKAKRSRLMYSDGFVAHMYDISEHVSPVLAWGFLGPEGRLKDVCQCFRDELFHFLSRLFKLEQVRYTSRSQMSADMLRLTRRYFDRLLTFMQSDAQDRL